MAIMAGPMGSKVLVTLTILALLLGKFVKGWDRVVSREVRDGIDAIRRDMILVLNTLCLTDSKVN